MNERQKLGARIREFRTRRNITQEKLGEHCNLSYKYLGNIERGRENPTFEALLKIARALEVEPCELLIFEHTENDPKKLRKELKTLIAEADIPTLQQTLKILRSLAR